MNFIEFIQLLLRNKKWVFVFPLLTACIVFFMTRNMPHTYSSDMVIYTGIASGYTADDMEGKVDYHEANSKFDNLINTMTSKETRKEVALNLMAAMLHQPEELKRITGKLKLTPLEWLNNRQQISRVLGKDSIETFTKLSAEIQKGLTSPYYSILFGKDANPFNVNTLSTIKSTRIGMSDMVKVEYTSEDAALTKKTLDILAVVFMSKYKGMRIGEVNNVVKYFEEQTNLSLGKLQQAEVSLRNFRSTNRVINYYEQTKSIADQKAHYEELESHLQMDWDGYKSALNKVESKISSRTLIQLKSDEIVKARNELAASYNDMGLSMVKGGEGNDKQNARIEQLKESLKEKVQSLYELNNSTEGMPGKSLLDEWLNLMVNADEASSKLKILAANKIKFEKIYDQFAPMGSDLSKLERDVEVSEKEYLTLLHNLNQAKLRERNLVVSDNISVTDPPDMPVVANSSKRIVLVIAGFMSCLILILTILILKEFMDDSISNPSRVLKLTGLKTATAFVASGAKEGVMLNETNQLSYKRWMLSLIDLQQQASNEKHKAIVVPFRQSAEQCKSYIDQIALQMTNMGYPWESANTTNAAASASNQLILAESENRELFPLQQLAGCKLIYLFMNAEQTFDEYQNQLLDNWKQLNIPIQVVLLETKTHQLEKFLGEIPKKRSRFRKFMKSILKRYTR